MTRQQPPSQAQRARAGRPLLAPFALTLVFAGGLLLGQLRPLVATPSAPADRQTASGARIARRFYDAVNATIATGDASSLAPLLADDFVDGAAAPGQPPTADGLLAYARSLAVATPTLRLTPLDLVAQADRVVVRLRFDGEPTPALLGVPLAGAEPWSAIEVLRIAHGRVAERWGAPSIGAAIQALTAVSFPVAPSATPALSLDQLPPLPGVPFPVPAPGWQAIALSRWRLEPGATGAPTLLALGTVLLLEAGELRITVASNSIAAATLYHAVAPGRQAARDVVPPGNDAVLVPGDLIVVPAGGRFAVHNERAEPATALVVTARGADGPLALPATTEVESTMHQTPLAGGALTRLPLGPATVGIARATLAPRAGLASHDVSGLELIVVESGSFRLTTDGPLAWVRNGASGVNVRAAQRTVETGDGVLIPFGATYDLLNVGAQPAAIIVVRILPSSPTPE